MGALYGKRKLGTTLPDMTQSRFMRDLCIGLLGGVDNEHDTGALTSPTGALGLWGRHLKPRLWG